MKLTDLLREDDTLVFKFEASNSRKVTCRIPVSRVQQALGSSPDQKTAHNSLRSLSGTDEDLVFNEQFRVRQTEFLLTFSDVDLPSIEQGATFQVGADCQIVFADGFFAMTFVDGSIINVSKSLFEMLAVRMKTRFGQPFKGPVFRSCKSCG